MLSFDHLGTFLYLVVKQRTKGPWFQFVHQRLLATHFGWCLLWRDVVFCCRAMLSYTRSWCMRESSDSNFCAFIKRERKITIFLFQNLRMISSCDGKALAALTKASLALSWQVFTTWTTSLVHTLTHPFFGTRIFLKSCLNQMPKSCYECPLLTKQKAEHFRKLLLVITGCHRKKTCWSQSWLLWHSSVALSARLEVILLYGAMYS